MEKNKQIALMNAQNNSTNFLTSLINAGVIKPKTIEEAYDTLIEYRNKIFKELYLRDNENLITIYLRGNTTVVKEQLKVNGFRFDMGKNKEDPHWYIKTTKNDWQLMKGKPEFQQLEIQTVERLFE